VTAATRPQLRSILRPAYPRGWWVHDDRGVLVGWVDADVDFERALHHAMKLNNFSCPGPRAAVGGRRVNPCDPSRGPGELRPNEEVGETRRVPPPKTDEAEVGLRPRRTRIGALRRA
jgi:hypothetical protein